MRIPLAVVVGPPLVTAVTATLIMSRAATRRERRLAAGIDQAIDDGRAVAESIDASLSKQPEQFDQR